MGPTQSIQQKEEGREGTRAMTMEDCVVFKAGAGSMTIENETPTKTALGGGGTWAVSARCLQGDVKYCTFLLARHRQPASSGINGGGFCRALFPGIISMMPASWRYRSSDHFRHNIDD